MFNHTNTAVVLYQSNNQPTRHNREPVSCQFLISSIKQAFVAFLNCVEGASSMLLVWTTSCVGCDLQRYCFFEALSYIYRRFIVDNTMFCFACNPSSWRA
jgi:hypothetical protein